MATGALTLALGGFALAAQAGSPWRGGELTDPLAREDKSASDLSPLVLTEVLYDSSASDDAVGEWFELYNPTDAPIDLTGVKVSDAGGNTGNRFDINQTLIVPAGGYVVLAHAANLGDDAFGVTADFVWTGDGNSFSLQNTRDTIRFYDGITEILAFDYDEAPAEGTAWPRAVNASIQLHRTLANKTHQDVPEAWCVASIPMAGGSQSGTPGEANGDCAGVDLDEDGYFGANDCDDDDADIHADAIELYSDGIDNDCDGIQLWQVIDDPVGDSAFGLNNELSAFAIGWDQEALAFGFDYTIQTNAVIWYFEMGVAGGETNFNSGQGYGGDFPTNVRFDRGMDMMAAFYGAEPLYLFKVTDNASQNITDQASDLYRVNSAADGSPGLGFVRVPWQSIYGLGAGKVPVGATLKILGVIRGSDNQGAADYAPNNEALPITVYMEIPLDPNEDGEPDAGIFLDADGDGYSVLGGDCNDGDISVYPGAEEVCDQDDQDCDGTIDEGSRGTYYVDVDRDGVGGTFTLTGCLSDDGLTDLTGDCNDNDDAVFPGNDESCDEKDNDCDVAVDEEAGPVYFPDGDGDGFRADDGDVRACEPIAGYVLEAARIDCDDTDGDINPDATEVCDGDDNDCDGVTDEPDAQGTSTFYLDDDGDGFGDPDTTQIACDAPEGYVADGTDCSDERSAANPGAPEICDGIDNNCDGEIDEDAAVDAQAYYLDGDGDGYGDSESAQIACEAPEGYVASDGDCDDAAVEINPDATEVCDGVDNDCDGTSDGPGASDAQTFYLDSDGDGYGTADVTSLDCALPVGYSTQDGDCDDSASGVYPGATEIPGDEIDQDCDGEDAATPTPDGTPTQGEETSTPVVTPTPDGTATPTQTPGSTETPSETATPSETETPVITPTPTPGTPTATPGTSTATPTSTTATPTAVVTPTPTPATPTPTATPGGPEPTPTGEEGEGCECGTGPGGPSSSGFAGTALLLLLGLGIRRRRA